MEPYQYPPTRHRRRHGPSGYQDTESYRPWLRDEFTFRCVYCLERERWSTIVAGFEIDHFIPVRLHPDKQLRYDNLLYACRACNAIKGDQIVPDPLLVLLSRFVTVDARGRLIGRSRESRRLIDLLQLNRPTCVERRVLIRRILRVAQEHDAVLYRELLAYPENLPDLTALRPPANTKPSAIGQSFHARRVRRELPEIF